MFRPLASAVLASAALLATAVQAQAPAGYYVATPAAAPAQTRLLTRDTPWQVRDGALVAARSTARDSVLCVLVAREVGALTGFSVGGKAYDVAALEKCNAKAGVAATAMADAN